MAPIKSKCPKGKIYVRGYKTKGSRKRASHRVKGHCVTDKGMPGKTPKGKKILPRLRKGEFGSYSTKKAHPKRMAILKRLISHLSYASVLKRLVLLRTYTRRSDPKSAKKYSADIRALQKFHKKHMKAGKKASSKKHSTRKASSKKRSTKRLSTRKRRVTRKKRTLKRKSVKKVSKRKSAKRKSAKRTKKVTKRKTTLLAPQRGAQSSRKSTTTRRRRTTRRRSTVMNK